MRPQLGKLGFSGGDYRTDLWRSAVGAWWAVEWFPRVPRGSLHDLAQVWHGLLRPEAAAEGRTEGKASHLGL